MRCTPRSRHKLASRRKSTQCRRHRSRLISSSSPWYVLEFCIIFVIGRQRGHLYTVPGRLSNFLCPQHTRSLTVSHDAVFLVSHLLSLSIYRTELSSIQVSVDLNSICVVHSIDTIFCVSHSSNSSSTTGSLGRCLLTISWAVGGPCVAATLHQPLLCVGSE